MKRKKNMAVLMVALACGVTASLLVVTYIEKNKGLPTASLGEVEKILVVSSPVEVGEGLDGQNTTLVNWPKKDLPEGYFQDIQSLSDMVAASRIPKGVPVTESLILSKKENLAYQIPKNHRAMTIDLTDQGGIPEFIESGSYVDVISTFDAQTKNPVSRTIIQNVKVMKVVRSSGKERSSHDRVTLLVTMTDAEKLSLAMAKGIIRIALRNQGDLESVSSEGINTEELIWGKTMKGFSEKSGGFTPAVKLPQRDTIEVIRGVTKKAELVKA